MWLTFCGSDTELGQAFVDKLCGASNWLAGTVNEGADRAAELLADGMGKVKELGNQLATNMAAADVDVSSRGTYSNLQALAGGAGLEQQQLQALNKAVEHPDRISRNSEKWDVLRAT